MALSLPQASRPAAPLARATVGVLGHVDHGKTSLVRALTGMETDRLREEKKRGLSIVPGFAWLESERGVMDFIDAPGHEDFIRMMIAGATGIDCALLVVAANEGIKPQTEEHFNIARLLGVDNGLMVISKADLATPQERARLQDALRRFTAGAFMERGRILEVSVSDEQSVDELRRALERQLLKPREKKNAGPCYLPLDRVFTMAGFGTVATGTLRNGDLFNGQEVEVLPQERRVRIRQLQVHNQPQEVASPGQRVAVNLRGVSKETLMRGDVLVAPGYLRPTTLLDVELRTIDRPARLPKRGETLRVLLGAGETPAVLRLWGEKALQPGATCMARLACQRAVAAPVGERFILRTLSPAATIGGGRILDNAPARRRDAGQVSTIDRLRRLASGDKAQVILELLDSRGRQGIDLAELTAAAAVSADELPRLLDEAGAIFASSQRVMSRVAFESLSNEALGVLKDFHSEHPARPGHPLEALRSRLEVDEPVFKRLIGRLAQRGLVCLNKGSVRLREFDPLGTLGSEQRETAKALAAVFKAGGFSPPELDEVLQGNPERERLCRLLVEAGELASLRNRDLGRAIVFHRHAVEEMALKLRGAYPAPATFTLSEARKLVNTSRKFAMPLLEHLDSLGITLRLGDKRKLL